MQRNTIQYNTTQYNVIQYNTIQFSSAKSTVISLFQLDFIYLDCMMRAVYVVVVTPNYSQEFVHCNREQQFPEKSHNLNHS